MAEPDLVPSGLTLVADGNLHRREQGRLLFGGAPVRSVRLSDEGAVAVDRWIGGAPVGDGEAERRLARRLLAGGLVHPQVDPVIDVDVTVVIPVLDDESGVRRLIERLPGVSIVVVDDGSTVPFRFEAPDVTIVRHDSARGPAAARMTGLDRVTTANVLFVDADIDLTVEDIASLLGHFVDPEVVAVAPRVASEPGSGLLAAYEEDFSPLDLGPVPSPVGPGRVVAFVPSATLLLRAEVIRAEGGFDSTLRYGEDVDLIWRLAGDGRVIRYDPDVVVRHRPRSDWHAWVRQRVAYGSSAAPLAARHGDAVAPARPPTPVLLGLGAAAIVPVRTVPGVVSATIAVVKRRVVAAFGDEAPPEITRGAVEHAARTTIIALVRAWWPITLLAACASRRVRCRVGVALMGVSAAEYARSGRHIDPVRGVALRLVDHLAYGVGVWKGVVRHRSMKALVPVVGNRGRSSSTATVSGL
jgi:mycofactocin system glycosyltransferase